MANLKSAAFKNSNVRLFLLFRVLFNARFYYPVFTVLFLDFGLSIEQFATLNTIWAATIVLLEVPTGALADTLGRRNLLRISSVLLLLEIILICFLPIDNNFIVFWALVVNRILSGAAEAFASGADEALAYDSLAEKGQADLWPNVLEVLMRYQSIAFVFALIIGSFVYDVDSVNALVTFLGLDFQITQQISMRFPLYLMLLSAVAIFPVVWKMKEVGFNRESKVSGDFVSRSLQAIIKIVEAATWIKASYLTLLVICAGLAFDNVIRMVLTLNSEYYRVIALPDWSFGIVGALFSILGIFVPTLARYLVRSRSLRFNFLLTAMLCFLGLFGMTRVWPFWGLIPVGILFSVMYMVSFMSSHYLNSEASSSMRATVLSFKGLAYNLAYGLAGLLYGSLAGQLRLKHIAENETLAGEDLSRAVFVSTLQYLPWYFLCSLLVFGVLVLFRAKKE